jgi:hypothetical protein
VRQHARGIDVDSVPARRFHDGNAVVGDVPAQVTGGSDAVLQVVGVQSLLQTDGDGIQIAPRQASISRKAFGQDEQVGLLLENDSP